MGQSILKSNRRSLRRAAKEEKNKIVSQYMTDNWDKVLVSSVALIRKFNFKNRFQIAMTILFKPDKKHPQPKKRTKDTENLPPRPETTPPPQKPVKSGAEKEGALEGNNGNATE
jgi:hypothetical protein